MKKAAMKKAAMKKSLAARVLCQTIVGALFILCTVTSLLADDRPNIILLMGDDHGWDETAYNGHPHLHTPVLDLMASSGLRLDNFYAAHPSCSPTRASVITGRHPNRSGTFAPNWSIRPQEISIATVLRNAGYACAHFGKWHLGPVKATSPTSPGAVGFEHWLSHDNFFELDPFFSLNGGPPVQFPGESSEILVDQAIEYLKETKQSDQPFFVVIWYGSPHEPYSGLPKDLALYDDLPESYKEKSVRLTDNDTGLPTNRPLDQVLRERYAEITAMDRSIGHLRDWLQQESLRDNTLLWYYGDNGTSGDGIVTSPFRGQKGNLYEGGVRVPCVIEWPQKITRPRVSTLNTVTSDTLPTIADLVGLSLPERPLDGISLKPLLLGEMTQRPSPIFFWSFNTRGESKNEPYIAAELQEGTTPLVKLAGGKATRSFQNYHHPVITDQDYTGPRSAIDNRYKLVVREKANGQPMRELFDLRSDPAETTNLAKHQPDVVEALSRQLRDWQQSVLNSLSGADYR